MNGIRWIAMAAAVALLGGVGAATAYGGGAQVTRSDESGSAYADPYGTGADNPAEGIDARVHAVEIGDGRSIVTLHVSGMIPGRTYGSHVHKLACDDNKAGGHYQHIPGGANDPAFANPENEVWLDFTANAAGRATSVTMVDWAIRDGDANAVMLHDRATDGTGAAGAKLACIDVDF